MIVIHVPEDLYRRMHSSAYTRGPGGWRTLLRDLRNCRHEQAVDYEDGKAEGRLEGINLAIQTLRDLETAEQTKGK